ncbi:hypothetical protein B0H14DRAFT_1648466 [Mycena olivaceomarginata]|nr:hypothetical protein B0H14DRAFT_1648466 [Mycena olivaceomarginata]
MLSPLLPFSSFSCCENACLLMRAYRILYPLLFLVFQLRCRATTTKTKRVTRPCSLPPPTSSYLFALTPSPRGPYSCAVFAFAPLQTCSRSCLLLRTDRVTRAWAPRVRALRVVLPASAAAECRMYWMGSPWLAREGRGRSSTSPSCAVLSICSGARHGRRDGGRGGSTGGRERQRLGDSFCVRRTPSNLATLSSGRGVRAGRPAEAEEAAEQRIRARS